MTAESANVIAGAEKNSPTITNSNSKKKVFWMSCKQYSSVNPIIKLKKEVIRNERMIYTGNL